LFDCGANKVHGTALLKYSGAADKSPFDGPTNYENYINIQGTSQQMLFKANQQILFKPKNILTFFKTNQQTIFKKINKHYSKQINKHSSKQINTHSSINHLYYMLLAYFTWHILIKVNSLQIFDGCFYRKITRKNDNTYYLPRLI
jgi:hypothetical protein